MMKDGILKSLITWLIIASPLWWTSGCYSYREITNPDELLKPTMDVVTKGNNRYAFEEWTVDTAGTITGQASLAAPPLKHWYDYGTQRKIVKSNFNLSRDSIKMLTVEGKTMSNADSIEAIRLLGDVEIIVTSENGKRYTFTDWVIDKSGTIKGQARWEVPFHRPPDSSYNPRNGHSTKPEFTEGYLTIANDSIHSWHSEGEIKVTTRQDIVYSFKEWIGDRWWSINGQSNLVVRHYSPPQGVVEQDTLLIAIPRDSIKSVFVYKFSTGKTLALVGAIILVPVVIAAALFAKAMSDFNPFSGEPPPGFPR